MDNMMDNIMNNNDKNKCESKYVCELHEIHDVTRVYPLSPGRFICLLCKKKRVHGYTNPDHVSNPFGYLYLAPMNCIECSVKHKKCMWCK
jgi:hypothetical protein